MAFFENTASKAINFVTDNSISGTYLTDVVRKAESVCKIPRLNGTACVVYGIPVQSAKVLDNWKTTIPECFKDIV